MNNRKYDKLSLDEGLSQSIVYSIIQDKDGFMWFGTQEGLNRYDGHNFRIFKKSLEDKNSIYSNYIKTIFQDIDGTIWLGTYSSGLIKYDENYGSFERIIIDTDENIPESYLITGILDCPDGTLAIGTFKGGMKILNKETNEVTHFLSSESGEMRNFPNEITCMTFSDSGALWIGTVYNGIYIYDYKDMTFTNIKNELSDIESIRSERIHFIYKDFNNFIWISTENGLNIYDEKNNCFLNHRFLYKDKEIIINQITSICEDKNNFIWIGTMNEGLFQAEKSDSSLFYESRICNKYDFFTDQIKSLYLDRSNVLWVGTTGSGIYRIDCEIKKFFSIFDNSPNSATTPLANIYNIFKDSYDVFWIGTYGNGICKLKMFENDFEKLINEDLKIDCVSFSTISGILENTDGNVWISTISGNLIKYDRKSEAFCYFKYDKDLGIHSICLANNFIWIATVENGLLKFNLITELFEEIDLKNELYNSLCSSRLYTICCENNNIIWIGTESEGLFKYRIDINELSNYKLNRDIPECIITSLHIDNKNNLWIGTSTGGIHKFDKSNFVRVGNKLKLNDYIHGVLTDSDKNIWFSTNIGLIRINSTEDGYKHFDKSDGLQSNEFNQGAYFKENNETLYFGGINGITYFHPSQIKDNPYIPNIVITEFEIFNKLVEGSPDNPFLKKNITYADEINLTYKESVFSFKFAALIFNNPQKNQYAYKMEGFDKDWTYSGTRRRVTYTNLDPGSYTFRVKGSNNDGIWNEEGTSIRINISPPYWKTWWFKSLGALSLIAATGISYRKRLEQMEKESRAQEDFSRKLIEVQENQMKRIAKELHDTIAHEVLISKQKAMMALKHKDDKDRMERTLEEISDLSSATITEVRSIAYKLRPHQLDKLGFTKSIKSIVNEVSRSTNINFVLDTDNVDEVLSQESEINLYRVVQETISNIIKHSGATEVILRVSRTEGYVEILIVDNGKGFDINSKAFDEARQGFGLSGIEERIKFMNGEINIDSELDKGTTLKFKIPIVNSDE